VGLTRIGITVTVAVATLSVPAGGLASAPPSPTYKQRLMVRCFEHRHISLGYFYGPYPANRLLGTPRDSRVTGAIIFSELPFQKGLVALGDGTLVFTKSASSAVADVPSLQKRFRVLNDKFVTKGNVVVMSSVEKPSLLTKQVVLACFRAGRAA
jgi:hypothetical protein